MSAQNGRSVRTARRTTTPTPGSPPETDAAILPLRAVAQKGEACLSTARTELDALAALADRLHDHLRHDGATWWACRGGGWAEMENPRARIFQAADEQCREVATALEAEAAGAKDGDERARLRREAHGWLALRRRAAIAENVQHCPGIAIERAAFDRPEFAHLVPARNGIWDLDAGKLLPADPSLMLTNPLPYNLDDNGPTDLIDEFLDSVLPTSNPAHAWKRATLLDVLVEALYARPSPRQQILLCLGEPGRGKSTTLGIIAAAFSRMGVGLAPSLFAEAGGTNRFELARLWNTRVGIIDDMPKGRWGADKITATAGSPTVTGEEKGKPQRDVRATHIIIGGTNTIPQMPADDSALWRRFLVIEFTEKVIDARNTNDPAHILARMRAMRTDDDSGVPEGAQQLMTLILRRAQFQAEIVDVGGISRRRGFTPPSEALVALGAEREAQDLLGEFLSTHTEAGGDKDMIPDAEFFAVFFAWLQTSGGISAWKLPPGAEVKRSLAARRNAHNQRYLRAQTTGHLRAPAVGRIRWLPEAAVAVRQASVRPF